jgi:hypothetical protein
LVTTELEYREVKVTVENAQGRSARTCGRRGGTVGAAGSRGRRGSRREFGATHVKLACWESCLLGERLVK